MSDSLIDLVENKPKLVPELRFLEFEKDGDWEEKTLGEVAERIKEKVNGKQLTTVSISASIGFVSQAEKFSRDISGAQYKNYIVLNEGEFSYNKGNSKRFPQGCIYKLKEFKQVAVPNAFISFRFKPNFISDFFQGYFDNNHHGRQLQQFITSGARMNGLLNIKAKDFFSIVLPTPTREEQQKIGGCLSSLEELITANREKLEALQAHKKGLMQNLFPQEGQTVPNFRFPEFEEDGEWEEKKLGDKDVSFFVGEKTSVDKLTTDSYVSTENMLPDYSGVKAASKLPSSGSFTKFKIGDILISNIRPYLKKVWKSDKSGGASNDVYVFRSGSHVESEFLEFIIKNDDFINYVMKSVKGVKMPRGDKASMREYSVFIPSKLEQQKISNCLSLVDELIASQTEKMDRLLQHKKGLMQGLFPKNLD